MSSRKSEQLHGAMREVCRYVGMHLFELVPAPSSFGTSRLGCASVELGRLGLGPGRARRSAALPISSHISKRDVVQPFFLLLSIFLEKTGTMSMAM